MHRLCVQLSGGLGNQMFQYAAARALAVRSKADLFLDTWSGFARDKEYKRHFELSRLAIKANYVSFPDQLRLWANRFEAKAGWGGQSAQQRRWYGNFIYESEYKFDPDIYAKPLTMTTWMLGYWQSPRYFDWYADQIQRELQPAAPQNIRFLALGRDISSTESVALGIRLYEESTNPAAHALHGKIKSIDDINKAVRSLCRARPNAKFFVFCTSSVLALKTLELPANTTFVTPAEGYADAVDCLWLLTRCKHHIFTNSSFYWWGAWLSHFVHKGNEQVIFAADNFINVDGLCEHWDTF
jgi:hypothetical protein